MQLLLLKYERYSSVFYASSFLAEIIIQALRIFYIVKTSFMISWFYRIIYIYIYIYIYISRTIKYYGYGDVLFCIIRYALLIEAQFPEWRCTQSYHITLVKMYKCVDCAVCVLKLLLGIAQSRAKNNYVIKCEVKKLLPCTNSYYPVYCVLSIFSCRVPSMPYYLRLSNGIIPYIPEYSIPNFLIG